MRNTLLEDFGVSRLVRMLSNGIRVVLFRKANSPISIRAVFSAGSRLDPEGKDGLAHFSEHMLVAGTKKYPTKDKLATYIEKYGGVHGGFTSTELMQINVEIAQASDIEHAIEVLSQIFSDSLFDSKVIETERKSILRELGEWKSNPRNFISEVATKLCFQETEVGRSVLGSDSSLAAITRQDFLKYQEEILNSQKMAIIVCGDIDVDKLAAKLEGKILVNNSPLLAEDKQLPLIRKSYVSIELYPRLEEVQFDLSFRTTSYFDEDTPALRLISTVLAGGRAATLTKKLRQDRGLVYTVYGIARGLRDSGYWSIRSSTSKQDLQETVNIICEEIGRVRDKGLTAAEIEFGKNKTIKSTKREMQTSESWVNFHSFGELLKPDSYLTLDRYLERISAIQESEIREVAKKYFKNDAWFLSICGDVKESEVKVYL